MKNINMKLVLAGGLLINVVSAQAMGRLANHVAKALSSKAPKISIKEIKHLNEQFKVRTSSLISWIDGKRSTEKVLEGLQRQARNGLIPSCENLSKLDSYSALNKYGLLNAPDEAGHTLLHYVLKATHSCERTKLLKALYYRGAQLNSRDKYVMGSEALLKALLNLPIEASVKTTVKVFRTFMTKNSREKLYRKVSLSEMSQRDAEERLDKVAEIKSIYQKIEESLLSTREQECAQAKRDNRMPVY